MVCLSENMCLTYKILIDQLILPCQQGPENDIMVDNGVIY